MKARVDRVIRYQGGEYRLRAGHKAPAMPDELCRVLINNGYLEAPAVKPPARKPKEG